MEPRLIIADEPIASLDISIQAQIVMLFSMTSVPGPKLSTVFICNDRTWFHGMWQLSISVTELLPFERMLSSVTSFPSLFSNIYVQICSCLTGFQHDAMLIRDSVQRQSEIIWISIPFPRIRILGALSFLISNGNQMQAIRRGEFSAAGLPTGAMVYLPVLKTSSTAVIIGRQRSYCSSVKRLFLFISVNDASFWQFLLRPRCFLLSSSLQKWKAFYFELFLRSLAIMHHDLFANRVPSCLGIRSGSIFPDPFRIGYLQAQAGRSPRV